MFEPMQYAAPVAVSPHTAVEPMRCVSDVNATALVISRGAFDELTALAPLL